MSYTKSELKELKVVELRPICRKLGISSKECAGKKDEIISLILKASKKASPAKKKSLEKDDSPKKKKVTKRTVKKSTSSPKKDADKSLEIKENLSAMTVAELKIRAKSLKVELPTKGSGANGGVLKSDIMRAIVDFESRKIGETGKAITVSPKKKKSPSKKDSPKKKSPSKKDSPKKKSPSKKDSPKKKTAKFCAVKGKNTCEGDKPLCRLSDGKCIKKSKNGEPRGLKKLKKEFGDDYYYDEKSGFVGKKGDVKKHLEFKKSPIKVDKVASKKVNPKCATADMKNVGDYKKCKDVEVCDIFTGQCEEPTPTVMSGKMSLIIDGRTIIGDKATIEKLHKSLGGTISMNTKADKKKSPKKAKIVIDRTADLMSIDIPVAKSPKHTSVSKKSKTVKPVRTGTSSSAVMESREKIYETFTKCLSEIGSK